VVHFSVIKPYVGGTFLLYQSHFIENIEKTKNTTRIILMTN